MIPIYYIEDLTIEEVDRLIERGVCFDITSKNTVLSKRTGNVNRDDFWCSGNKLSGNLRDSSEKQNNC